MDRKEILNVENLRLSFHGPAGKIEAVKGVTLTVSEGEIVALVGESGCGKTALCRSIMMLHAKHATIDTGRIIVCGREVSLMTESELEKIRGTKVSMIFQDPMSSLNPVFTTGHQIMEPLMLHEKISRGEARERAAEILESTGIDNAKARMKQYPHQFSGGMRQRVAIAIALACSPNLIIADEPTTALDIKTQQQIISLLKELCTGKDRGMLFVTHDLAIAEEIADRIIVMKDGLIVEEGRVEKIFSDPKHEYTKELLRYARYGKKESHFHGGNNKLCRNGSCDAKNNSSADKELLRVENLTKVFESAKGQVNTVLENFSMTVRRGEIVGIIGPSGCGKSTLARCIAGIYTPDSGKITLSSDCRIQMVFQDSSSAFNPRMRLGEIIAEPLVIKAKQNLFSGFMLNKKKKNTLGGGYLSRADINLKVAEVARMAELDLDILDRYPYDVSGGQRQRAAIARALITEPNLIIADEPVSSLDVSTQAQIVHLFRKICDENNVSVILIAHDIPMVAHVSDRIINEL